MEATEPSLQKDMDTLDDPSEDSTHKVQVGSILHRDKREYRQEFAFDEGACILDLLGDLADGGQINGAIEGNECYY